MKRWIKRSAIATVGLLAVAGFGLYVYAPYGVSYGYDAPTKPLPNLVIGSLAPDFTLTDQDGKPVTLSALKGKLVALEWTSPTCEFTANHYKNGHMQQLQKDATAKGVIWLTINSAIPKSQNFMTPGNATARIAKLKANMTALLLDTDDKVGRSYGARTTPSVYLINTEGRLVYSGAVDDAPWGDGNPYGHTNYVRAALDNLWEGRAIKIASTRPYGCGVKYYD